MIRTGIGGEGNNPFDPKIFFIFVFCPISVYDVLESEACIQERGKGNSSSLIHWNSWVDCEIVGGHVNVLLQLFMAGV